MASRREPPRLMTARKFHSDNPIMKYDNMTTPLRDETARCMSCLAGMVSLKPDHGRYSFHCSACGYVVPCFDYNARAEPIRGYCAPGWDSDNTGKPVPHLGDYAPRQFAWGCLTCLGTVTAITWQAHQSHGGLLVYDHGRCERCGHVVRVSPAHEHAARFRAFAPDGSRRPADA